MKYVLKHVSNQPCGIRKQNSILYHISSGGLPLGQNVTHATFGQGVVLAVEGSGAHTRVQVKFREHGVKWLVLAYANLI